jgi:hypothetical protein
MKKITIILVLLASTFFVTAQTGSCQTGDCVNGYGTYVWDSYVGDKTYTGNWKNGKQNGMGKYDFIEKHRKGGGHDLNLIIELKFMKGIGLMVDIVAMEYILTKQAQKITRYCLTRKNMKVIG